jgi:hypothetical protein
MEGGVVGVFSQGLSLGGCLNSQRIESLRAQRSNLYLKKRLPRRLRLLAMTPRILGQLFHPQTFLSSPKADRR